MATEHLICAQIKIIWARKHLDEIKEGIRSYLKTEPYFFPSYSRDDLVVIEKPRANIPPGLDIEGNIGDFLGAMLASLDYIIWDLCENTAGRKLVPPPDGNDRPSFPLYINPERFKSYAPGMARYQIPAAIMNEIEEVQPYHAGYEPLAYLWRLGNQDKHRLPVLTFLNIKASDLRPTYDGQAIAVTESSATSVAFKAPTPRAGAYNPRKVNVEADVTTVVAFDELSMPREPVEVTLTNIYDSVVNVFARFLAVFDSSF
jgi:hypothetical protein